MATNRFYAPRIRIPDVLERGRSYNADLPVYRDNAIVTPTVATFKLIDGDGTDIIPTTAATISGGIANYAILAGSLPSTLSYSDNYMQIWTLTLDGEIHIFRSPCALAKSSLYPVVSDLDLEALHADLSNIRPSGQASYQIKLDEAWCQIIQKLRDMGNLEYLIMSPESLRAVHQSLTLYFIYRDADSTGLGDGRYIDLAREYKAEFEADFKTIQFKYDVDQDGIIDNGGQKRSGYPVIFTNRTPPWRQTSYSWRRR